MDGNFSRFRLEDISLRTDNISDIISLEIPELLLRHGIFTDVQLDLAEIVLDMAEDRFAHNALGHNSSGDPYRFVFKTRVIFSDIVAPGSTVVAGYPERIPSLRLEFLQLIAPHLQNFRKRLFRLLVPLFHLTHKLFILYLNFHLTQ